MVLLASSRFSSLPSDVCKRAEVENHDGVIARATNVLQGQLPSCQLRFPGDCDLLRHHPQIRLTSTDQKVSRFAEMTASLPHLPELGKDGFDRQDVRTYGICAVGMRLLRLLGCLAASFHKGPCACAPGLASHPASCLLHGDSMRSPPN